MHDESNLGAVDWEGEMGMDCLLREIVRDDRLEWQGIFSQLRVDPNELEFLRITFVVTIQLGDSWTNSETIYNTLQQYVEFK